MKIDTYSRLLCAKSIAKRDRRGGCYEGEKQRVKGKQEGAADEPQREEKAEEGEEEQVDCTVSHS